MPGGQSTTRHACTIRRSGTSSSCRPTMCPPNTEKLPPALRAISAGAAFDPATLVLCSCGGVSDALVNDDDFGAVICRREAHSHALGTAVACCTSVAEQPRVNKLTRRRHNLEDARNPQHRAIWKPVG